jgi:hypothetical protein
MYLSTFMFGTEFTMAQVADATVFTFRLRPRRDADACVSVSVLAQRQEVGLLQSRTQLTPVQRVTVGVNHGY